jgi:hypothetical protein
MVACFVSSAHAQVPLSAYVNADGFSDVHEAIVCCKSHPNLKIVRTIKVVLDREKR